MKLSKLRKAGAPSKWPKSRAEQDKNAAQDTSEMPMKHVDEDYPGADWMFEKDDLKEPAEERHQGDSESLADPISNNPGDDDSDPKSREAKRRKERKKQYNWEATKDEDNF